MPGDSASASAAALLEEIKLGIDGRLAALAPVMGLESHGMDAGLYAVAGPAGRLRGVLTEAVCLDLGGDPRVARDAACAIELLHGCSVVLDDLPVMDDGAARRGRPSHHAAFGVPASILTALALFNQAFAVAAKLPVPDAARVNVVRQLSEAVHPRAAITGQLEDLGLLPLSGAPAATLAAIQRKTAKVFETAYVVGALAASQPVARARSAGRIGAWIGTAYQIVDDGADRAQDQARGARANLFNIAGSEAAREAALHALDQAERAIETEAAGLRAAAHVRQIRWQLRQKLNRICAPC